MEEKYTYEELLDIIEELRGENGCPWDKEQTHQSLIPCLLEESYELMEALQNEDTSLMKEELGDVLLQVLMHAQIAKEEGLFTLDEIVHDLAYKLVYRHPHVFQGEEVTSSREVLDNWEVLKQKEKQETSLVESMERVAKTLPSLVRAQKLQKKAIKYVGQEIDEIDEIDALIERLNCVKNSIKQGENVQNEEKIGEILLRVAKLSAFFDINAEFALTKSLEKFINRFRYIENSRFIKD